MVQLRDTQTSELIAEGTPLEIATIAESMAAEDILFDDVGSVGQDGRSLFDPVAVRKQAADDLVGHQAALDALPADAWPEDRETLRAAVKERRDHIASGKAKVAGARKAMQDARIRVEKRRGR